MLACMRKGPLNVISAVGMLNGGRILHHLKHRLPFEANTVLFCGYQVEGTKGRFPQDNVVQLESLRIHHQQVPFAAEIATIQSLSAIDPRLL
jgi:metallo-beta-lactamase family protein